MTTAATDAVRKRGATREVKPTDIDSTKTGGNGDTLREGAASNAEYAVEVEIEGVTPILFHRWDTGAVESKSKAAKNSVEKKTDNLESYVYRDKDGNIGIPAAMLKACLRDAGRSMQDPRSPRKSAVDLIKASLQVEPFIAPMLDRKGKVCTEWEYVDDHRVVVQRSAINRRRPAFTEGWSTTFTIVVLAPEYISERFLHELVTRAGRFVGIADFRPEYGRFSLMAFKVRQLEA
jgi:hypothetical protein